MCQLVVFNDAEKLKHFSTLTMVFLQESLQTICSEQLASGLADLTNPKVVVTYYTLVVLLDF